jgi:hypothetical protein
MALPGLKTPFPVTPMPFNQPEAMYNLFTSQIPCPFIKANMTNQCIPTQMGQIAVDLTTDWGRRQLRTMMLVDLIDEKAYWQSPTIKRMMCSVQHPHMQF